MTTTNADAPSLSPLQRAFLALEQARARLAVAEGAAREPVAVIGIGCRVPGADDPQAFWEGMLEGRDAIGPIPPDRWNVDALYDADPDVPGRIATRAGGFLRRVDGFDAEFFGIAPREAQGMDPQQRLLLEVAWEALEHAGQPPDRLEGSRTGVFVGMCNSDYAYLQLKSDDAALLDAHFSSGVAHSIVSGRLSYLLGLQGPSLTIDTACSSSLVAVHLACQSLRNNDCRMALAGGVNLILSPEVYIALSHSRMLAPDGRCKTFDAAADGFARGEGCAVVVLKCLRDAVADGDRVLAVIRGSAVNQDGPSSGLTAPNGPAQEAVIREALERADVKPSQVGYVEAHGTGTQLGDPLEVRALGAVFGAQRDATRPLLLGSVKTNIGHLEAAAGVTGLVKVVLALRHRVIPPHLHFREPSPHIQWNELPLRVPTSALPWEPIDGRRIAGVSSFGFSGTNAHVVIEEAPAAPVGAAPARRPAAPACLLTLSARTDAALRTVARRYAAAVKGCAESELADICFAANTGRAHLPQRATIVAHTIDELHSRLLAVADGNPAEGVHTARVALRDPPRVAFLFTGQGAQYSQMARGLYEASSVFRAALDHCAQALLPWLARPLLDILFPATAGDAALDQTEYAQPALFAVEYALTELWRSWGVVPSVVMGHSLGEYSAACTAGVFSLDEGLRLVANRGRLMQSLPAGGAMAAVFASERQVNETLATMRSGLCIAAVNAPGQVVVSGTAAAVDEACGLFHKSGVRCQPLGVSHAFHSALVEPILDALEAELSGTRLASPRLRLISNLTGHAAVGDEIARPRYWRRHARHPVRFAEGLSTLAGAVDCVVEIGPHPTLLPFARSVFNQAGPMAIASLHKGTRDWDHMLDALASLYLLGSHINWRAFADRSGTHSVELPTYPFQRERFWFTTQSGPPGVRLRGRSAGHGLLGTRLRSPTFDTGYEACVSADWPPYVRQHRVLGHVVMPATAYLDTLVACARDVLRADAVTLEDVHIEEAMLLSDDGAGRSMQTLCAAQSADGTVAATISSLEIAAADRAPWTVHVRANLRVENSPSAAMADFRALRSACCTPIEPREFYRRLQTRGLMFGADFRSVRELWSGDFQAFGAVELDPEFAGQGPVHCLHPVLLDGCVQVSAAALADDDAPALYMPIGIKRLTLHRNASDRCWSHAVLASGGGDLRRADIRIFNDDGELVAEIIDMQFKRVERGALARLGERWLDDCLYETRWHAAALPAPAARELPADAGLWLVFADRHGTCEALAGRLREQGAECILVRPGSYELQTKTASVDPAAADGYQRLFFALHASGRALSGVIHGWSLDTPAWEKMGTDELARAPEYGVVSALRVAQALVSQGTPAPLWIITRGAQAADPADGALAPAQAPMWGFAKALALEHPELRCVCVDLAPTPTASEIDALRSELLESGAERAVALRQNTRRVARIARLRRSANSTPPIAGPRASEWRLVIPTPGSFEDLAFVPLARRALGPGEVEVAVEATALNFKDVLNVLGMYPGEPTPLGGECAGRVLATGAGVTHVSPGDEVMAVATGSFSSHVIAAAHLVQRRPPQMSAEEGASLPIAYLTAQFCLDHLAGMKTGDRVLIHAAAGGVGMAAVRLAQRAGAEIFATAGSSSKRDLLRRMGIVHVFDSRTPAFAASILERTGGRGVDIVLNSLSGDLIDASFAALAAGGCFVEIGKRGIKPPSWVDAQRRDWRYFIADWSDAATNEPELLGAMFARLTEELRAGALLPLPRHVFGLDQTAHAFRFMAQARHAGKIVLRHRTGAPQVIRRDGSYLVTGGLSGLGLRAARWLAQRGAGRIVLIGRRGVTSEAAPLLQQLREDGTPVIAEALDVADEAALTALLERIRGQGPPLRGVLHCAGVLDDAELMRQNAERFTRVFAPKVQGARLLDNLTRQDPLDWFVLFSSIAGVIGSPGQCNYSAANAFLDVLAQERRKQGLPALSIDWGAWAETGAAADLGLMQRITERGLSALSSDQGVLALERLIQSGAVQAAVLPVDWSRFLGHWEQGAMPTFFADMAGGARPGGESPSGAPSAGIHSKDLHRELAEAPVSRQRPIMAAFVRDMALRALGADPAKPVDPRTQLGDLGLDSLLAVELRNRLGKALGLSLPSTLLFDYPSIDALTDYLLAAVLPSSHEACAADGEPATGMSDGSLVDSIESMSDEEVDRLVAARAQPVI